MTPAQRKASIVAIAAVFVGPLEGLRQWAYVCPAGVLTVCEGHTGPDVVRGKKYSLEECKALLDADMLKAVNVVERCHPGLPVKVAVAFSSAVFNIGPTVACNSTASKMLDAKDYSGACNQLPRWNKAKVAGVLVPLPGLTTRRELEKEICLEYEA